MSKDLQFIAYTIIGLAVSFAVLFGFVTFGVYEYESRVQCPRFALNVERPHRYDFLAGGCFVQTKNGQWVASKNYWNSPVQP